MFDMDKLYQLMERGWNIGIECKGKGRNYEMTFEATASKVVTDDMTKEEIVDCMYNHIHTVGDTLEEILDNLTVSISKRDSR